MDRSRKYPERSMSLKKRLRRSSYPFLADDPFDEEDQADWQEICCGCEDGNKE